MKFWKTKAGEVKNTRETKSSQTYDVAPDSFLSYVFGRGTWITAAQAAKLYRSTAAIATSVDMIASAVKQIEPVIETSDGKFINDHPILTLLKNPNGFDDWMAFVETLVTDYLLKHDTLILASGNVKFSPAELWPSSLQSVSITQHQDDYPGLYSVTHGPLKGTYTRNRVKNKGMRFYDDFAKELFHINGYSSRVTKLDSDSPIQAAAMEAKQLINGKYHNVKLLENGARLSLLVTFNDDDFLTTDEHNQRKERLNEQFGGSSKTGGIGVISGADIQHVKEFGKTNKDMDFAKLEKMASYAIYLRYQIPLALVTIESSTFNNLQTGIELLYDNAVIPNAKVIFAGLTKMLLPRYGMDPTKEKITYNPESIEPLKKRRLDEVNLRSKIGIESYNELRSLISNRGPIPGGNDIYRRSNMEVVGVDPDTSDNNDT